MKLMKLILTPDGNEFGEVLEAVIDHNPEVFKPCYVRVVRMLDGSEKLTHYPPNIQTNELDGAVKHASIIIDIVHDITSGF